MNKNSKRLVKKVRNNLNFSYKKLGKFLEKYMESKNVKFSSETKLSFNWFGNVILMDRKLE
jgi:hypothetical protein